MPVARLAGIKLLLFPLTKQQIESTTKMQAIAPAAKALQERYRERDPARLNAELQKLYQDNEVNPLAGCVPALAQVCYALSMRIGFAMECLCRLMWAITTAQPRLQIPLFIGLYRALLNLAKEDKLAQPFLWLPSLEGPVADYTEGIGWLTDWVNGAPKYGWSVTGAYLVLPVLLVASQYLSMELLSPKSEDPAQQQSQAILKFLPLMIGWFSLSVPSGLGLYWLTNNVITTASTLIIREMTPKIEIEIPGAGSAAAASPANTKGFGGRRFGEVIESRAQDGSTVRIKPPGSQTAPSTPAQASIVDPSSTVVEATVVEIERDEGSGMAAEEPKKKMAKKQRKKKRN